MPDPAPTLTFSPSPSSGRGPIATPRVAPPPSPAPRATASRTVRPTSVGDPDRDVLVALYHATDGPNWANNAGWLSDAPLGEWHGVVTDRTGRVTRLALDANQLIGEIPAALGRLDRLAALWLSGNQLSGAIPSELGRSLPAATARDPIQPVAWSDPAGVGPARQPGVLGSSWESAQRADPARAGTAIEPSGTEPQGQPT